MNPFMDEMPEIWDANAASSKPSKSKKEKKDLRLRQEMTHFVSVVAICSRRTRRNPRAKQRAKGMTKKSKMELLVMKSHQMKLRKMKAQRLSHLLRTGPQLQSVFNL